MPFVVSPSSSTWNPPCCDSLWHVCRRCSCRDGLVGNVRCNAWDLCLGLGRRHRGGHGLRLGQFVLQVEWDLCAGALSFESGRQFLRQLVHLSQHQSLHGEERHEAHTALLTIGCQPKRPSDLTGSLGIEADLYRRCVFSIPMYLSRESCHGMTDGFLS